MHGCLAAGWGAAAQRSGQRQKPPANGLTLDAGGRRGASGN